MKKVILLLCLLTSQLAISQSGSDTLLSIRSTAVLFGDNEAGLSDTNRQVLQKLVESLAKVNGKKIILEGHTNGLGSLAHNQKLSERRNDSVKKTLIGMGIDSMAITSIAYGKTNPEYKEKQDGRVRNRQVKITVKKHFLLVPLEGRVSQTALSGVKVLASHELYRDSTTTNEKGEFVLMFPNHLEAEVAAFKEGYLSDVTKVIVDAEKRKAPLVIPMMPVLVNTSIHFKSINFYGNKNIIIPRSQHALENLGRQIEINKKFCFEIQGHVNAPGVPASMAYQYMDLSISRAGRIYGWLQERGIDAGRMVANGYAHVKMLYPNSRDEKEQQANRRIEIHILDCEVVKKQRMQFDEAACLRIAAEPGFTEFRVKEQQLD
ncbi:MAG: OmpA family protein [Saprospiraceae bacterium]|nr:OmpA family protein [Saprospiraceae bacterium]